MGNGSGLTRPALRVVVSVFVAAAMLGGASPAAAVDDWFISGTVVNSTGSDADNCPGGNDQGCIFVPPGDVVFEDASNVHMPSSPLPNGITGFFSFQADGFFEGADMYAQYTMPDENAYEIIAEDDVGVGGTSGNYAGCSETGPQGSAFVCSAQWGGTIGDFTPTYSFSPSWQAPVPAAGQRCAGELGGGGATVLNCTATGQFGPTDAGVPMRIILVNLSGADLYVTDLANGDTCQLQSWKQPCTITTTGSMPDQIEIGPLDPSGSSWYGVEIVATAHGPILPDSVPTWPPSDDPQTAPAPRLSALAVSPPSPSSNRGTVRYRSSRPSTTVFTLARARSGGRGRGRWKLIGKRRGQTSITVAGVRRRGRCRPATARSPVNGPRCAWRREMKGHFVHRDRAGRNRVRFGPRLVGRALKPGRYRLTARARARGTGMLSGARSTTFRIRR